MPDLCTRHRWTLHRWREIHHHETKRNYRQRCNHIARACPTCTQLTNAIREPK